jgi:transcriptional regulator with PAS, ATPase and Fis domain
MTVPCESCRIHANCQYQDIGDDLRFLRTPATNAEPLQIDAALARRRGNRRRAAEELGISLSALKRKLRRRRRQTPAGDGPV